MKQCMALAVLVCLVASGCAQMGREDCGDGCSGGLLARRGPRPLITRDGSRPNARLLGKDCRDACGCGPGGCCLANGVGGACGECDGCSSGGPCCRLADKIAGGMCNGACGACGACGVCPHAGGYPEQPTFNPGPPTGQVAYPYYTTRGPRDFLRDKPPTIGPY